jgi:hypothetical protein
MSPRNETQFGRQSHARGDASQGAGTASTPQPGPEYPGAATAALASDLARVLAVSDDAPIFAEWDRAGELERCSFDDALGEAMRDLAELRRRLGDRQWRAEQ